MSYCWRTMLSSFFSYLFLVSYSCCICYALLAVPPGCYLHPSVSIVNLSPSERGIRVNNSTTGSSSSSSSIEPNEILLSVPWDTIITADHGRATSTGKALQMNLVDDHTYLALWITSAVTNYADNPDFHYYYYLKTLPKDMSHLPIFWSSADLDELKGTRLYTATRLLRRQWEMLYLYIVSQYALFGKETSLDTFLWAKALVQSRVFFLREDYLGNEMSSTQNTTTYATSNTTNKIGLVPLADMLNHKSRSDPSTCDWRVEKALNAFVIRTSGEGLSQGSEACISYGLRTNAHYLANYGFCIETNCRHDGASPEQAHIYLKGYYILLTIGNKPVAKRMLSIFRRLVSEKNVLRDVNIWKYPYSLKNERAAMKRLHQAVETALSCYPTSLEQDMEALLQHSSTMSSNNINKRNAILVRSGEKNVLQHWLFLCSASLVCLDDVERNVTSWKVYCNLLETTLESLVSIAT